MPKLDEIKAKMKRRSRGTHLGLREEENSATWEDRVVGGTPIFSIGRRRDARESGSSDPTTTLSALN
jgi:hypothetical protein